MQAIWIDPFRLLDLCNRLMDGHISYGFGIKANLHVQPEDIKSIDCSGFVRYLLYNATYSALKMPDGSWMQHDWCQKSLFEAVNYATADRCDGWLRIAFLPPKAGHAGHVWLVQNGATIESHGGKGPDRRPWDTTILKSQVTACYKLAQTYILFDPLWQTMMALA